MHVLAGSPQIFFSHEKIKEVQSQSILSAKVTSNKEKESTKHVWVVFFPVEKGKREVKSFHERDNK